MPQHSYISASRTSLTSHAIRGEMGASLELRWQDALGALGCQELEA